MRFTADMSPGGRASLYHDLAAGRRLELDALSGAVVRFGEAVAVGTPMNRAVYAALKPHDLEARGEPPGPYAPPRGGGPAPPAGRGGRPLSGRGRCPAPGAEEAGGSRQRNRTPGQRPDQ